MKWKTGEVRKHRLLGLSDQFYTMAWELIETDPPSEITGAITTLTLHRITEHEYVFISNTIHLTLNFQAHSC